MKQLKSKAWWSAATIRALKTAAQAAVGVTAAGFILNENNIFVLLSTIGIAMFTSFCTSLSGLPEVVAEEAACIMLECDAQGADE